MTSRDTIVAPATPPGKGGVGIVRISGPKVKDIALTLLKKIPPVREATYSKFFDEDDSVIDEGIVIFFENPHSFTGEDVLELQGHGGPIIIDCLIKRILALGARYALPGEFSLTAFLNNKIDLAQAEAVAALIDATSVQSARAALRSLQGEFSKKINEIVSAIIHLRMYVEAAIDFVEEEIDFLADDKIKLQLENLLQEIQQLQQSAMQGALLRDGINLVIVGAPNVGKSSLLNSLCEKDIAIVTDIAGTTRDVLREIIHLDGMPIHIIDTAGLRKSTDPIEQEGIRRAQQEMKHADLILHVFDATLPETLIGNAQTQLWVRNKIDLIAEKPQVEISDEKTIVSLSVKTGAGLNLLKEQIKLAVGFKQTSEGLFSARRRHVDALQRAEQFIQHALEQFTSHKAGDLVAEELRQAQLSLNEITGVFTTDDLLGKIFSSFCIGK